MTVKRLVSQDKLASDEKIQATAAPLLSLKKIDPLPGR